ncbi:hypothetical protein [Halopseudomonas laoshanensis]|uniref:hypothetical protein n=1 Tax=Halopseudomonas laoshanensis TaxID=2268758 RepID=UPI003735E479
MKRFSSHLLTVLLCFLTIRVDAQSNLNIACSDPELRVMSVFDEEEKTIVKLTLRTTSKSAVSLYPPSTEGAFFAMDADSGSEFKLIGFDGVEPEPGYKIYPPHTIIYIKLVFEEIKASKFHLIEGTHFSREGFWTCMNIKRERY